MTFSAVSQEIDEIDKIHDIYVKLFQMRDHMLEMSIFYNDDFSLTEFHETIEKIINEYNELKDHYDENDIISIIDFSIDTLNNVQSKSLDINSAVSQLNIIIKYMDSLQDILLGVIYLSHYKNNNGILPNSIIENDDVIEANIDLHIREILKIIYNIKFICHDMDIINYNTSPRWMHLINIHIDAILNMNEILERNITEEERIHITAPLIKLLQEKINELKKYVVPYGNYYLSNILDEIIDIYSIIRRLFYYYPINENNSWIK
jgi:hypothetical protein